ncbi:hypothetical protein ALC53_11970 [Atta colombica]|uniref:Uncharacterized protein n=1 Tax=Atta colombica TaxID=520822 RepID=A0A195B097_9HYME|nr:hypothetical protein ALC53_11970 [Atta colombica]
MWILAKYCHATAPIDQQSLHAFLTNNPRGYSHSYQSHSGIYMRNVQRITTRTLISIEMANDNFSVSSHLIYDVPVMEDTFTIQADLATRSKNVAADPLSDRFYSSLLAPSWPISRTWTTLVRSLSASRLALASQASRNSSCSHARISRVSDALRMYIAYENPCAK